MAIMSFKALCFFCCVVILLTTTDAEEEKTLQTKMLAKLLELLRSMPIGVGDSLPSMILEESTPTDKVNIADLFAKKKGVLFAVPGAFLPRPSMKILPGYADKFEELKKKGAEVIACVSINDPFVMAAWGRAHTAEGKAIGMENSGAARFLGNARSKGYSMVISNGVVKSLNMAPDDDFSAILQQL